MFKTGRIIRWLLAAVGVVGCGLLIGFEAQSQIRTDQAAADDAPLAPMKPFIAHQHRLYYPERSDLAPGVSDHVYARRSDGSYVDRWDTDSPMGEHAQFIQISDLRMHRATGLEPFTRSAVTFWLSAKEVRQRRHDEDQCGTISAEIKRAEEATTGSAVALGHPVVSVTQELESHTVSMQVARDLGCYALHQTERFKAGAYNEFWVLKIEDGEPSDSVFAIPADYVERSPQEVDALYASRYPGHKLYGGKYAQLLQSRYFEHEKYRP